MVKYDNVKIEVTYVCDCCSANFTIDEKRTDREYKVKMCPFCGNEYLEIHKKLL
jgi:DNA-directed RNA polymerase subunit RPC12/RpoP